MTAAEPYPFLTFHYKWRIPCRLHRSGQPKAIYLQYWLMSFVVCHPLSLLLLNCINQRNRCAFCNHSQVLWGTIFRITMHVLFLSHTHMKPNSKLKHFNIHNRKALTCYSLVKNTHIQVRHFHTYSWVVLIWSFEKLSHIPVKFAHIQLKCSYIVLWKPVI